MVVQWNDSPTELNRLEEEALDILAKAGWRRDEPVTRMFARLDRSDCDGLVQRLERLLLCSRELPRRLRSPRPDEPCLTAPPRRDPSPGVLLLGPGRGVDTPQPPVARTPSVHN